MPCETRTWNAAIASEFSSTITAETGRGASVCSATHSGRPLESIPQHSERTPIMAASETYGRSRSTASRGPRPDAGTGATRGRPAIATA
jgi:hypothetical protein